MLAGGKETHHSTGFTCGIIGLPNLVKSTLINAFTAAQAQVANYPFTTIDPNIGLVPVPDPRLDRFTGIHKPGKTVPTTLKFLDIAGLVKGISKGEGLGNRFLNQIRNVTQSFISSATSMIPTLRILRIHQPAARYGERWEEMQD